ncbi:MAG: histidinol phosphate phosphatase domain-containing protein [Deferribacteraceae bacterium]|jgi:histidinol phosphatase-like PHP family hydrolase|nr:histidinol phosphate phosphatase domain-containing protein [Deferribacteraceae bacterium]
MIVDLHTHTTFSDGALIPAESARRARTAGYSGIAVTDHADHSNLEQNLTGALRFKESYKCAGKDFAVLAGVELTHVRPSQISELTKRARELGADIVNVHGETIIEPVEEGTNRAAVLAGVDILAHPGLITEADARLAAEKGVYLEITTRRGHALSNGHVAHIAKLTGAKLVVNNDAHSPGDYAGKSMTLKILQGAGLTLDEAEEIIKETVRLFKIKDRSDYVRK